MSSQYFESFFPARWPQTQKNWSRGIAEYLKQTFGRGLPIYLNAEDTDLVKIAELGQIETSDSIESDFLRLFVSPIIEQPLKKSDATNLFHRLHDVFSHWKPARAGGEAPPFLHVLLMTVLAADRMHTSTDKRSTNYYGRLCEILGIDEKFTNEIGSSYRKHIAPLWILYCHWLESNPHFGLPTAYADTSGGFVNYVGVPVSQALLRSHEQQLIERDFFKMFIDGSDRENIDPEEFLAAFKEWVYRLNGEERLKRAYDAAPREVEDAIWSIYQRWNPSEHEIRTSSQNPRLFIGGRISSRLGQPVLNFYLHSTHQFDDSIGTILKLEVEDRNVEVSSRFDSVIGHGTQIHGCGLEDLLCRLIKIRGSLRSPFQEDVNFAANRQPRAVVQFEAVTESTWIERRWMRIGETCNLLIAQPLLDRTISEVRQFGLGGELVDLQGVPDNWKLMVGFTVTSQPEGSSLLRIQSGSQRIMHLVDGTRALGSGRDLEYFANESPKILVDERVLKLQNLALSTVEIHIIGSGSEVQVVKPTTELNELTDILGGTYVVELVASDKLKSLESFPLRLLSPEHPRSISSVDRAAISMRVGTEFGCRLWTAEELDTNDCLMQGAAILDGTLSELISSTSTARVSNETGLSDGIEERDPNDGYAEPKGAVVRFAQCVISPGAKCLHIKNDEARIGRVPMWIHMTCVDCGTVTKVPTRGNPKKFNKSSKNKMQSRSRAQEAGVTPSPQVGFTGNFAKMSLTSKTLDIESRIWALGSGSKRTAALLADLNPLQLPNETLWYAAAAGHVDLPNMETDLIADTWRVTPSVLAKVSDGTFRLVGHRTPSMIAKIIKLFMAYGTTAELITVSNSPYLTDLKLRLSPDLSHEYVANIVRNDPELDHIMVIGEALQRLIYTLPNIGVIKNQLTHSKFMNSDYRAQVFDLDSIRWSESGAEIEKGSAIRDTVFGSRYFFVEDDDPQSCDVVSCGFRLAKHLSAWHREKLLFSYDPRLEELRCPIGADLPLIYSRGIIFATGVLPARDRSIVYRGVSEEVSHQITLLLSR